MKLKGMQRVKLISLNESFEKKRKNLRQINENG